MCVHGLGDHRNTPWKEDWQAAIAKVFANYGDVKLEFSFVTYDPIFEKVKLSAWETMQAVWKLSRSAVSVAITGRRGIVSDVPDKVKWTAGYVVAWVEDAAFQQQTRKLVLDEVTRQSPDVILAHSLGSLITYNAFSHPDAARAATKAALARTRYVTLGSQIGNPFVVRNLTNGRIEALPVKQWQHLYNKHDAYFTAPIMLWDGRNFQQIETPFDIPGVADHSATDYLRHENTVDQVWLPAADVRSGARSFGGARGTSSKTQASRAKAPTSKRALLVGINAYPREEDRLEGCVNDVFLMSSVLQECGFPPECIRVCLDERATTKGILERLQWLLDDPKPDEHRVFYYSGHGTRIPEYGENFQPDRHTEALVPWDFDWSTERAIIDDQIFALYSQLPYDTRFAMIMDCCHAGGMHRQGGARVRGLNPPDDIRHRELKWDSKSEMWVQRDFNRMNPGFSSEAKVNKAFFGKDGATSRIGRSSSLRGQSKAEYRQDKQRNAGSATGPYLPLIIEACGEAEFSYEYRHGVISHGAFTYALSKRLRKTGMINFQKLVDGTREELAELGYQQTPQILGPAKIRNARVPWMR
jgi:hypothetical protein